MYLVLPNTNEVFMGFEKINNVSLTDLFVQQIENLILSGELEVGEQLPPARELSIQMGVSRPVISAGLIELEKLGFVEIIPRKGAFVCDYRRKGTVETLVAIMRYNGGAMRKNEVISLLQVRESLECLTVQLVIEQATKEEILSLEQILNEVKDSKNSDKIANAIFKFHHKLAVLSKNMLLPLLYHSFKPESLYLWKMSCRTLGGNQLIDVKLTLLEALIAKDLDKALSLTKNSIDIALKQISDYIS